MLESIGVSLIGTIISFLFDQNVLRQSNIDIQGVPNWYEQKGDPKKIYVSTYVNGDIKSIGKAKNKILEELTLIIEDAYRVTIKKKFERVSSKKEILFIKKMKNDSNLFSFIKQNTVFRDIKYNEDIKRTFIRGYIHLDLLEKYQTKRILVIKKEVLDYQFGDMMEELDREAS